MHNAIYRCRSCHKKYSIKLTNEESIAFDNATFKNEDCAKVADSKILHRCKNGAFGVADLQGFKRSVIK